MKSEYSWVFMIDYLNGDLREGSTGTSVQTLALMLANLCGTVSAGREYKLLSNKQK